MKSAIAFFAVIATTTAIDVKFNDNFGGLHKISIPTCKSEPCDIVQGIPLVTFLTFAAESPKYDQNKNFEIFTTGYLSTMMGNYGDRFGVGLTNNTDLTKYDPCFPLKPKQVSTAKVPLVAPWIDPKIGPFKSTGEKFMYYLVRVGNDTDFITVVSASITLNVIH